MRGCIRGSPSSKRLRGSASGRPIARCDLASRLALTLLECKAAYHAARRAQSGLGSAFRPAYSALRCEAAAQAALPPCEAASDRPLGPALTPLECEVAYHAARQARSG
eukprot:scaffold10499_cov57-Phaeocystis_antarctica.AAC.1